MCSTNFDNNNNNNNNVKDVQIDPKSICKEIKDITKPRNEYEPLASQSLFEKVSPTLISLMALISPSLEKKTLPAVMAGGIITSSVSKKILFSMFTWAY